MKMRCKDCKFLGDKLDEVRELVGVVFTHKCMYEKSYLPFTAKNLTCPHFRLRFSPSQLVKYRRCRRMYAFEYVEGFFPASSDKQSFGTAVHSQLERWFKHSKPPENNPEGEVAKQGLRWLPVPSKTLLVEHHFEIPWNKNFDVGGYIDCVERGERLIIIDHKTTSDLKWAKTEGQLAVDEQAIIYSAWAMLHFQEKEALARWVYYSASNPASGRRKPQGSKPVETVFRYDDNLLHLKLSKINTDFNDMYRIRKEEIKGSSLLPSPESCGMYGGCPHREARRCEDLNPEDIFFSKMDKK